MDRTTFAGTWRLISWEMRRADGTVRYPFGKDAAGLLVYDPGGFMSGQMMRRHRPRLSAPRTAAAGVLEAGPDEIKAAFTGYVAYCGTFDVDAAAGIVTHHVECALLPDWVGIDQVRQFELDGDRITLRTPPVEVAGQEQVGVLVWERA